MVFLSWIHLQILNLGVRPMSGCSLHFPAGLILFRRFLLNCAWLRPMLNSSPAATPLFHLPCLYTRALPILASVLQWVASRFLTRLSMEVSPKTWRLAHTVAKGKSLFKIIGQKKFNISLPDLDLIQACFFFLFFFFYCCDLSVNIIFVFCA